MQLEFNNDHKMEWRAQPERNAENISKVPSQPVIPVGSYSAIEYIGPRELSHECFVRMRDGHSSIVELCSIGCVCYSQFKNFSMNWPLRHSHHFLFIESGCTGYAGCV